MKTVECAFQPPQNDPVPRKHSKYPSRAIYYWKNGTWIYDKRNDEWVWHAYTLQWPDSHPSSWAKLGICGDDVIRLLLVGFSFFVHQSRIHGTFERTALGFGLYWTTGLMRITEPFDSSGYAEQSLPLQVNEWIRISTYFKFPPKLSSPILASWARTWYHC